MRHPRRLRSRKPYLLLEVLIAFSIVSLCLLPLLRPHFTIAKHQHENLRALQLEIHAHQALSTIREKLYNWEITWDHIRGGTERAVDVDGSLPPIELDGQTYQIAYNISQEARYDKQTSGGRVRANYRINKVKLTYTPAHGDLAEFEYELFTERIYPNERQV